MDKTLGSLSGRDIDYIHNTFNSHLGDGDYAKHFGIIAVLDVLGWKKTMTPDKIPEYFGLINSIRSDILDTALRFTSDPDEINIKISILSDTLVLSIDMGKTQPYCEWNLFSLLSRFLTKALKKGFAFRGAISRGEYYTNSLGNVFVGDSFYEAATYCEKTDWAGIIITDSLANALLENNTVEQLKSIFIVQYDKIPFKKDILPPKENLVLMPSMETFIDRQTRTIKKIDFKQLYGLIMDSPNESIQQKYHNTCCFIDYLENNSFFE